MEEGKEMTGRCRWIFRVWGEREVVKKEEVVVVVMVAGLQAGLTGKQ